MYDVIIIGAGPAGLFTAYELSEKNKELKILLLDKGKLAKNRHCPMNKNKIPCQNCNPCQIMSGYGGAGTFSDGKLNFIPKLGKSDLFKYMTESEANELINDTEKIFNKFDMDSKIYPTNIEEAEKIKKQVAINGAKLLLIKQKHLGSDKLPTYIQNLTDYLGKNNVEIKENTNVIDINTDKNKIKLMKSLNATKWQIYKMLILRGNLDIIISSLKINISMCLIGIIMGELLVSKEGIGYLIMYGSQVFNLNLVMTGILLLAIISYILYFIVSYIEKKLVKN